MMNYNNERYTVNSTGLVKKFIFILGCMCFIGLLWAYYKAFQSGLISNLLNELNIKRENMLKNNGENNLLKIERNIKDII